MDVLYGVLCFVFSIIAYRFYINWRKFKKRIYESNKLEVWDYRLFTTYWFLIIISILASIIFLLKLLVE